MNGWIKGKFLGQNGALVDSFFNLFPCIFFLLQFCSLSFQHTEHKKPACNLFYLNFWSPASSSVLIDQVRAESVPSCHSTEPWRWFPPLRLRCGASWVLSRSLSPVWQSVALFTEQLKPGDAAGCDSRREPGSHQFRVQFTNNIAQWVLSGHGHTCRSDVLFRIWL